LAAVLATALVGGVLVVGSPVIPAAAGTASDAPTGDIANSLCAVSCSSPANCVAVGMSGDPSADGYWLVASDRGIFSFGAP
jgi:hypothetical protein